MNFIIIMLSIYFLGSPWGGMGPKFVLLLFVLYYCSQNKIQ